MKIRDLQPIVQQYYSDCTLIDRVLGQHPEAIRRLMTLSAADDDQDKMIAEIDLRIMLKNHWNEIKNTPRDYINTKTLTATEKAYIALANALDNPQPPTTGISYIKIETLMPGVLAFTRKLNLSYPVMLISGKVFEGSALINELKENSTIEDLAPFNQQFKNYDKATVNLIYQYFLKPAPGASRQVYEWEKIREIFKNFHENFDYVQAVLSCTNTHDSWNFPLGKTPERYFFKTESNIGLDIRTLFLLGFVDPVSKQPLTRSDMDKLEKHIHLGLLVKAFKDSKDHFILPQNSEHGFLALANAISRFIYDRHSEINFVTLSFDTIHNKAVPLEKRQDIYSHFRNLAELSGHLHQNDFINNLPENYKRNFLNFQKKYERNKQTLVWSEMENSYFFRGAAIIVGDMRTTMGSDWDLSTQNFFNAMYDFAIMPDLVINDNDRGYIYSNGEYLVRVPGLDTREGAKKALASLVDQFKGVFEIAYRYHRLDSLMRGMTPAGVCIAEKMKHLATSFAQVSSIGTGLENLDDIFAKIMQNARKKEIELRQTWNDAHFLNYIIGNYADNISYLAADKTKQTITRAIIIDYMRDIMNFDVTGYVPRVG